MPQYFDFKKIATQHQDYLLLSKHKDLLATLLRVQETQWLMPEKQTVFSSGCLTDIADFMVGNEWNGRIVFRDETPLPRTLRWTLHTTKPREALSDWHGEMLGEIKWYAPWRQYCLMPYDGKKFNRGDVRDIASFLKMHVKDRTTTVIPKKSEISC